MILTSYKETQVYNGLNTGKGNPSNVVVKIFLVSNVPSLECGLGTLGFVKAPVISRIPAARRRNKIKNTCWKPLPGSHSYIPRTSLWTTHSHMGPPTARAVEEFDRQQLLKKQGNYVVLVQLDI